MGGLEALRGVGKIVAPATPLGLGANALSLTRPNLLSGNLNQRVGTGLFQGMTGEQNVAGNVPDVKTKMPIIGDVDLVKGVSSLVGFAKNPVNDKIFKLTNKILPSASLPFKQWLVAAGSRGGIENLIMGLPDMPKNLNDNQKVQFIAQTFGTGALMNIGGEGILKYGGKVLDKSGVTKSAIKIFDELSEFRRRAFIPVKDMDGSVRPMWQVSWTNFLKGEKGIPKTEEFTLPKLSKGQQPRIKENGQYTFNSEYKNKYPSDVFGDSQQYGVFESRINVPDEFNINQARQKVKSLNQKTNLTQFVKTTSKSKYDFAYIEDLKPETAKEFQAPAKTVISSERVDHLRNRPTLFDEVIKLLPDGIKNPDVSLPNPKRANSFIVVKKGTKNYGIVLEIDKVGEYNFVRTVQPMKQNKIQQILNQLGRPAVPPSISSIKTPPESGNIVSALQTDNSIVAQKQKISQELSDFLNGKVKDTINSPVMTSNLSPEQQAAKAKLPSIMATTSKKEANYVPSGQKQQMVEQGAKNFENWMSKSDVKVKDKVGILDYLRTPDRVLTKIGLKRESDLIRQSHENYIKELPVEIDKITEWANRAPNATERIFDYLDGKGTLTNPNEIKVAKEIRPYLEQWADRLGLPKEKRITNYITHIFDKDLIQKEFDPELAKLITDKVAGSVYDPFTQQRLGKLGYKRDVWAALDAYVKRAVRKVNMDPALKQIKKASEKLETSQYDYVKNYVDRINMRPTKWDNLLDNTIKSLVGYKFGQRPTTAITQGLSLIQILNFYFCRFKGMNV